MEVKINKEIRNYKVDFEQTILIPMAEAGFKMDGVWNRSGLLFAESKRRH